MGLMVLAVRVFSEIHDGFQVLSGRGFSEFHGGGPLGRGLGYSLSLGHFKNDFTACACRQCD